MRRRPKSNPHAELSAKIQIGLKTYAYPLQKFARGMDRMTKIKPMQDLW